MNSPLPRQSRRNTEEGVTGTLILLKEYINEGERPPAGNRSGSLHVTHLYVLFNPISYKEPNMARLI